MKTLFASISCVVLAGLLAGCATTSGQPPRTSNEALAQLAVSGAITVAVDRVVTRDHAAPADVEARAGRIVAVVEALQALGGDALSTLPKIDAALTPLLDRLNLDPVARNQANILVKALVTVGLERTDASKYLAQVAFILSEVKRMALAYLPSASPVGWLRNGLDRLELSLFGDRRRLFPACS